MRSAPNCSKRCSRVTWTGEVRSKSRKSPLWTGKKCQHGANLKFSRSASKKWGFPRSLPTRDRKSTRLNSSHSQISYAVFCLKKKKNTHNVTPHPHDQTDTY